MGNKKIGPAAVAGAIVLVLVVIYGVYRAVIHDPAPNSEATIPAYAKARMGQGGPVAGAPAPYSASNHPGMNPAQRH